MAAAGVATSSTLNNRKIFTLNQRKLFTLIENPEDTEMPEI